MKAKYHSAIKTMFSFKTGQKIKILAEIGGTSLSGVVRAIVDDYFRMIEKESDKRA